MDTKDTFLEQKVSQLFHCEKCDVSCSNKSILERHINSRKPKKSDKKIQNDTILEQMEQKEQKFTELNV